jgi:gamma-glutamyltranspeptidase / glutathione hydrolase
MNIQAALEAPRFTKLSFDGLDVQIETRIPEQVRAELTSKGHLLEPLPPYSLNVGGGQAVMFQTSTGNKFGASDPRKDGSAIPEPAPTRRGPPPNLR